MQNLAQFISYCKAGRLEVPPKGHTCLAGQVTLVMSMSVNGKVEPISREYYQGPMVAYELPDSTQPAKSGAFPGSIESSRDGCLLQFPQPWGAARNR